MTTIHDAVLQPGASSADLTVSALEPHGIMAECECQVFAKTTTGPQLEMCRLPAGTACVIYPTSATLVVKNCGAAAGYIKVHAK